MSYCIKFIYLSVHVSCKMQCYFVCFKITAVYNIFTCICDKYARLKKNKIVYNCKRVSFPKLCVKQCFFVFFRVVIC